MSATTTIQRGPYTLQRSPPYLYPYERHLNVFQCLHYVSWTLWLLHVVADFFVAFKIQQDETAMSWQVWLALISSLALDIPDLTTAFNITLALWTSRVADPRADYRLLGHVAPTVDIMITACGEPSEVVVNTATAAAMQDYPSKEYRVFVLDDGHDPELELAINLLSKRLDSENSPKIVYISRTISPGEESFNKSGNLRFGIEYSRLMGQGSELLAGLDADMIPDRDWLRRMVTHLLLDDKVAIAAPPQV